MQTQTEHQPMTIDERFEGLPEIAHGGYVAGALGTALGVADAEVRLKRPVPTGRDLRLEHAGDGRVELHDGETLLAEAAAAEPSLDPPLPVTLAEAEAASKRFPGFRHHPYPGCLVCGPDRGAGDGLRLFPGPVPGRRLVAAPWVPPTGLADSTGRVPAELVSAALDCPQLWSLMVHAPASTPDRVVTAALRTTLGATVAAGEPHVVIAWPIGREGRSWLAGAAVIGPDGELCAIGRQTAAVVSGWGVPLGRPHWAEDLTTTDTRRTK